MGEAFSQPAEGASGEKEKKGTVERALGTECNAAVSSWGVLGKVLAGADNGWGLMGEGVVVRADLGMGEWRREA